MDEIFNMFVFMLGGGFAMFAATRLFAGDDGSTWYIVNGCLFALGVLIMTIAWSGS